MSNFKFAHLLGLKKKSSEEEDDGKEKSKKAKSRKAEDERDDEEDADDDDDREGMEDDDDSDPDDEEGGKTSKKGKKAKSRNAEDDGDDADAEEDEDENRDVKKGRSAERKRCAAIFGSKAAAGRPDMAAHLAFNTELSASAAIGTLSAMGAVAPEPAKKASLDDRMRQAQDVRLGPDASVAPSGSAKALVEKAASLYNSTQGKK
ncbi:hypothetical protein [Serratia fonticola]|uniref:Uncharacterized protein n=1 Tax=Serratia fonticola TaxID=47917 RepID=A0ABY9PJB7_SERFO|nr:hypothetical protein [Serratia fonticola]WMT13358.1 hypothetical protein RFB13_19270 [Serratia fonticola]